MFLPILQPRAGFDTKLIFLRGVLLVWLQFSFSEISCQTKIKEFWLPDYLLILEVKKDWFMPFPMALARSETQTALSRIWSQVANSVSYDDNVTISA